MNLNLNARKIADQMISDPRKLGIAVHELQNGATVLDCGVKAKGGIEAGRLFALACMGGLADIWMSEEDYDGLKLQTVNVRTSQPRVACISSQKAGWKVKTKDFFAMGSGPARVLAEESNTYAEDSDEAVLALECSKLPGEEVAEYVADKCEVTTEALTLLAARTASIAGSVQISARMVETALYKMDYLKINLPLSEASGKAPVAPVKGGDGEMMGITNDMIIYGSHVSLKIKGNLDPIPLPSNSSSMYGVPFMEIFANAGHDFYKIDPGIFAPAQITVEDTITGAVKTAGKVNVGMIKKTLEKG